MVYLTLDLPILQILIRETPACNQLILQWQHFYCMFYSVAQGCVKAWNGSNTSIQLLIQTQSHELSLAPCNKTHSHIGIEINKWLKARCVEAPP